GIDLKILVSAVQSRPCPPVSQPLSDRSFRAVTEMSPGLSLSEAVAGDVPSVAASARLSEVALGDDRVASIHALGFVPDHLHGHGVGLASRRLLSRRPRPHRSGGGRSKTVLWYSGELGLVIKTRAERFSNHYRGPGVRETEVISYDFKP